MAELLDAGDIAALKRDGIVTLWQSTDPLDDVRFIENHPEFVAVIANPMRHPQVLRHDGILVDLADLSRSEVYGLESAMERSQLR